MRAISIAILGIACSGGSKPTTTEPSGGSGSAVASPPPANKCETLVAKLTPALERKAAQRGKTFDEAAKAELLADCKQTFETGTPSAGDQRTFDCVIAAADDAAVEACMTVAPSPRRSTAVVALNGLAKAAKISFLESAAFPTGQAGPTPPGTCCGQPDNKCASTLQVWSDPVWQALDFGLAEATAFQYRYASDGTKFSATAVGDLDCDGTFVTYTASGVVVDGQPQVTISEPSTAD